MLSEIEQRVPRDLLKQPEGSVYTIHNRQRTTHGMSTADSHLHLSALPITERGDGGTCHQKRPTDCWIYQTRARGLDPEAETGWATEGPSLQPKKQGTNGPSTRTWTPSSRRRAPPRLRTRPLEIDPQAPPWTRPGRRSEVAISEARRL